MQQDDALFLLVMINPGGHLKHDQKKLPKSWWRRSELKKPRLGKSCRKCSPRDRVLRHLVQDTGGMIQLPIAEEIVHNVVCSMSFIHVSCHFLEHLAMDEI